MIKYYLLKISQLLKKYLLSFIIPLLSLISPACATKILYYNAFHKKLNLKNPITLNDKILWLKLYTYRNNPLINQCSDKVRVREYVEKLGLANILIPLFFVGKKAYEINWNILPDCFVLKCNHGAGFNILCDSKSELNKDQTVKTLNHWLKINYWMRWAEINYRYIPRRILCEKYLVNNNKELPYDYKIYCFNGCAKYTLVCIGRIAGTPIFYFFDENWNLTRINNDSINADVNLSIPKPLHYENMLQYARILSKPFPFVRVDFYIVDDKIYFGEMTFTPSGGLDDKRLPETDILFGSMVNLDYKSVAS